MVEELQEEVVCEVCWVVPEECCVAGGQPVAEGARAAEEVCRKLKLPKAMEAFESLRCPAPWQRIKTQPLLLQCLHPPRLIFRLPMECGFPAINSQNSGGHDDLDPCRLL